MPSRSAAPLVFYPAYCFPASPTWFAWVKLTAHDIHRVLRTRAGFAASTSNPKSELLFYLNHPIQYVQVIGVVVGYDDYDKFWAVTVDDGSAAVIECVCWKPDKDKGQATATGDEADTSKLAQKDKDQDVEQQRRENVIKTLDIGTVVQVKGTVTSFRHVRQIQIERLSVVPSTNHEVVLIAARTKFLEEILIKPWEVSPNRQKRLCKDAQGATQRDSERTIRLKQRLKKLEAREQRHAEKIARDYERDEAQREEGAKAARQAGEELRLEKDQQPQRLPKVTSDDFADLMY